VWNQITAIYRRFRPEDPRRMSQFRLDLASLSWEGDAAFAALSQLFAAVDALAEAEVRYYFRRRGTRAWVSGITRFGAWVLGSIGLLLPLLGASPWLPFKDATQYGYAFLAAAASCLAANALFGGTSGHVRFVGTQLELERLVTKARIDWCAFLAERTRGLESVKRGFALIHAYAHALYATTITETGNWSAEAMAALARYESSLQAARQARDAEAPRPAPAPASP